MRNRKVALAVASVLASAAASAANVDLYIAGASAQSAFWKADFGTSICGGSTNVITYNLSGVSGISNEAWRCTATTASGAVAIGDQVTVHYNSHFGSISGAAALIRPSVAKRLYVNPDSLDCATSGATRSCAITGYNQNAETFTSVNGTALVQSPNTLPADVVVLDMELKYWAKDTNWQPIAAFGTATPTLAEVTPFGAGTVVNGQVFSVIANNSSPIAAKGNISKESMKAIVTGIYDKWGDVPEVGGGNTTQIKLCRREQGSGTQIAASVFFTGAECGLSGNKAFVTAASPGALGAGNVTEETSTGSVRTCVQGTTGAIGITSVSTSSNYTTLNIDGVQANAHNAAAGMYTFAFEDIVYNQSATSGASTAAKDLANLFITNAKKATLLTSQIESTATQNANGTWTATAPKSNYALPILGVNTKSLANSQVISGAAVTALAYRGGDNCKMNFNSNTN